MPIRLIDREVWIEHSREGAVGAACAIDRGHYGAPARVEHICFVVSQIGQIDISVRPVYVNAVIFGSGYEAAGDRFGDQGTVWFVLRDVGSFLNDIDICRGGIDGD